MDNQQILNANQPFGLLAITKGLSCDSKLSAARSPAHSSSGLPPARQQIMCSSMPHADGDCVTQERSRLHLMPTWHQYGNVIAIQQYLLHVGCALALRGILVFCDVLEHHIDEDIETAQSSNKFLIPFHDDPDLGPNTSVNQFAWHKMTRVALIGCSLWGDHFGTCELASRWQNMLTSLHWACHRCRK